MLEHLQYFGEDGLQDERENVKLWDNNALYADEVVEWLNACFDIFLTTPETTFTVLDVVV